MDLSLEAEASERLNNYRLDAAKAAFLCIHFYQIIFIFNYVVKRYVKYSKLS